MSILHRDDVHLIDYLRVVHKRRIFMAIVLLVALGSALIMTKMQVPIYGASTSILVDSVATIVEFQGVERHRRMRMDTEKLLMKSREVAEYAVSSRLRPDLKRGDPAFEQLVSRLRASTNVSIIPNTLVMQMNVNAEGPEIASDWCNAMAESYVELNFEASKQANSAGAMAMREEIDKTQRELEVDERKLLDFKQEYNIVSGVAKEREQEKISGTGTGAGEAAALRKIEARQKYLALKRWYSANEFSLPLPSDLVPSPLVIDLYGEIVKKRSELNALLLKYREQHPKAQELKAALATAQKSFDNEIRAGLSVLEKESEVYSAIETAHKGNVAADKRNFLRDNERDWQYRVLQRNVDVKEDIYKALLTRLGELSVASSIVTNNVRVVEQAKPNPRAVRPNVRMNMLLGLVFGLVVAVAGVFFLEYLDKTLKTPDDIATHLGLPVLAVVPIARPELLRAPYERPQLRDGGSIHGESAA